MSHAFSQNVFRGLIFQSLGATVAVVPRETYLKIFNGVGKVAPNTKATKVPAAKWFYPSTNALDQWQKT